jgi:hypothetical protein
MKAQVGLGLFLLVCAGTAILPARSLAEALEPKTTAPKRVKVSCAQYRESVEKTAKHAAFDTRIKPGSWARIPPDLRKLPRRAKLCGVDSRGQAVIASPLFGKELEDYYTPLFSKAEFGPLICQVTAEQTQCRSKRKRDVGVLVTDATSEIFVLAVVLR